LDFEDSPKKDKKQKSDSYGLGDSSLGLDTSKPKK
jgi:hypothetical protein